MKHTIKIKENVLEVKVTLKRMNGKSPRVRFGMPSVYKLIEENFEFPKGQSLGEYIGPVLGLDNSHDNRCKGTWLFKIVGAEEKKPKPRVKKTNKKQED